MNIDWSKAPEGATHAGSRTSTDVDCWYKDLGHGSYEFWYATKGQLHAGGWMPSKKLHHAPLIPRPVTWTGEGLPPVGIEIEALLPGLGNTTYFWQRAKVVHGALPDSPGEVLVFSLETTRPAWVDEFRPIRTPEQIAEEERDKAIDEMVPASPLLDKGWSRRVCEALYDAGYRKQVAP